MSARSFQAMAAGLVLALMVGCGGGGGSDQAAAPQPAAQPAPSAAPAAPAAAETQTLPSGLNVTRVDINSPDGLYLGTLTNTGGSAWRLQPSADLPSEWTEVNRTPIGVMLHAANWTGGEPAPQMAVRVSDQSVQVRMPNIERDDAIYVDVRVYPIASVAID
jgi:hypothetical protein